VRIPIDTSSSTPLYLQIVSFLQEQIEGGTLKPGDRLPSTRELAKSLGVNRITVSAAYADLEGKGLVMGRHGSGTYVGGPVALRREEGNDTPSVIPAWQTRAMERRSIPGRKSLPGFENMKDAGFIDFSTGTSDPRLFPLDDFRKALQAVIVEDGVNALSSGDRLGYAPLRETIASILATQGIPARGDRILLTGGSQQGAHIVAATLLKPGDAVAAGCPTYSGIIDLFRNMGIRILPVRMEDENRYAEELEAILRRDKPGLIYVIPNFNNPTGTCMSGELRRHVVALSLKYEIPVVEDDFAGDFRYEGKDLPALKALDRQGTGIYISTFSNSLVPGVRTGFILAEGPALESFCDRREVEDMAGSDLIHRALTRFITVGRYHSHLRKALRVYRWRRDLMGKELESCMPDRFRWELPQGGLFIWLETPSDLDPEQLLTAAVGRGVGFAPGRIFYPGNETVNRIRLNFTAYGDSDIKRGIGVLGQVFREKAAGVAGRKVSCTR